MRTKRRLILGLLSAVGLLAAASSAKAGTATWNFDTDPTQGTNPIEVYQEGYYKDTSGNNMYWKASGGNPGGFLGLTWPIGSSSSIMIFPDIDGGKLVTAFKLEADLRVGNPQQDPRAADGFSINFARATDPVFEGHASGNFATGGAVETGTTTGLSIIFDTWSGNALPDGNDIEGIIVRLDNVTLLRYDMPTRNGTCADATSLQTGTRSPEYWSAVKALPPPNTFVQYDNVDAAFAPDAWTNLCWQHLSVEVDNQSQVTVIWKGVTILDKFKTAYFPSAGALVLAGRTGGADEHTHFDNMVLTTTASALDTTAPTTPGNLRATSTGAGRIALAWDPSTDDSGRVAYELSRDGAVIASTVNDTNYVDFPPGAGKAYTYKVRAFDVSINYSPAVTLAVTTAAEAILPGALKVEVYDTISGTAISDLTSAAKFPASPDRGSYCLGMLAGSANGLGGWNNSFGDNLGIRITGVLTPTESGQFNFFIRSDDASAFYLNQSGASLPDPATATALVKEDGCCSTFLEPGDATKPDVTTAAPVNLTAGQSYGFVVLMKEGGGGDGVAVGMRKVGDTTPAANVPAIGGLLVSGQSDPVGALLTLGSVSQFPGGTISANDPVTFTANVTTNFSFYSSGVWYQWLKGGVPIPGATAKSYKIPATLSTDNSAKFSVAVGTVGIVKTSAVATLTVSADTKKPTIAGVAGTESLDTVTVTFSEPVTSPTAVTTGNYVFTPALAVTAANLVDAWNVRLTTAKQGDGTVYALVVNNVADNAGNAIAADTKVYYKSWGLVPNRAKQEFWLGISGVAMDDLYNDPKYAGAPDAVRYINGMNTGGDYADNYGSRVKAYFIPAENGSYNFFLRSDDASQLYLSSNDQFPTVPGATWIAEETGCCSAFLEPNDSGKPTVTTATPIAVTAGTRYAIQAMLKEGGGGDYVQVAKRKVGDTTPAGSLTPMSSDIYWYGTDANVLVPTNAIVPTSANSPAAEKAPNAIDGNPATKYLNFDKLNTGFTVTPSGACTLHGIALTSANDEPARDPASYKIEGSVDGGKTWAAVGAGSVDPFPYRFTRRVYYFDNNLAYTSYKVTFPTVANASSANSMQIADVELLGLSGGTLATVPTNPALSMGKTASGDVVITFEGTLESSPNLTAGPWTVVPGTGSVTVTPGSTPTFYRSKK